MTNNGVTQHEKTWRTGVFVDYLLAEIAGDVGTVDSTADEATMRAQMDALLGATMDSRISISEFMRAAAAACRHLSEWDAGLEPWRARTAKLDGETE